MHPRLVGVGMQASCVGVKCRSRSIGRPSLPRTDSSSDRLTEPSSGQPMPRSHRPKAMSGSSGSISVRSQVQPASGVKSFTTGRKSGSDSSSIWNCSRTRPFLSSRSRISAVKSFMVVFPFAWGFLKTRKRRPGGEATGSPKNSVRFGRVTKGNPQTKESLD